MRLTPGVLVFMAAAASATAQTPGPPARTEPFSPAVLATGEPMALPLVTTVGSCEVALEVAVDATGAPTTIDVLRSTEPCTTSLVAAVKGWRFTPADQAAPPSTAPGTLAPRTKVRSKVLVVAIVNPPTIMAPTFGTLPTDVRKPSAEVPWPSAFSAPGTSPMAFMGATTMIEVRVSATGRVDAARVIRSGPPYDDSSLAVVRGWNFTAARRTGRSVPSIVYVMFGFPTPVMAGP